MCQELWLANLLVISCKVFRICRKVMYVFSSGHMHAAAGSVNTVAVTSRILLVTVRPVDQTARRNIPEDSTPHSQIQWCIEFHKADLCAQDMKQEALKISHVTSEVLMAITLLLSSGMWRRVAFGRNWYGFREEEKPYDGPGQTSKSRENSVNHTGLSKGH
jgi:hypothetical protein